MNIRCLPCKFSLSWSVSSFPVQQVNRISMSQFGNYVEMQTSADTYCSIGDEIVRNENATVPPQMLAQRSLSSPDHVRNLPRPPPAQPVENPIKLRHPTAMLRRQAISETKNDYVEPCQAERSMRQRLSFDLASIKLSSNHLPNRLFTPRKVSQSHTWSSSKWPY